MSSEIKLEANTGRDQGSRSSRRLRREDKIPAVVYGQGKDPLPVTLVRPKFRAALNAAGPNAVITLDVDGNDCLTIVKNIQRDPIANRVTHVDFMLIDIDQRLIVDVPITLTGDAVLVRQEGAVVQQQGHGQCGARERRLPLAWTAAHAATSPPPLFIYSVVCKYYQETL